jgi:hypothetical protein
MQFFYELSKEAMVRYVMKLIDDNPLRSFDFELGSRSDSQTFLQG